MILEYIFKVLLQVFYKSKIQFKQKYLCTIRILLYIICYFNAPYDQHIEGLL